MNRRKIINYWAKQIVRATETNLELLDNDAFDEASEMICYELNQLENERMIKDCEVEE